MTVPWRVEQLRITLFSPSLLPRASGFWQAVTGEDPPRSTKTPEGTEESGPIAPTEWLVTRASLGRADLVIAPPPEEQLGFGSALSLLEPLKTYESRISDIGGKFVEAVGGDVVRIALGAVLMAPADSKADGYAKMAGLLDGSVSLDPASSDFLYQINRVRARRFDTEEIQLNRLTKWSVALLQQVQVRIGPGVPALAQAASPLHACRLELDLSTEAGRTTLPGGQHLAILTTLFSFGLEIADKGDVK